MDRAQDSKINVNKCSSGVDNFMWRMRDEGQYD